jgi:hypothetical protein
MSETLRPPALDRRNLTVTYANYHQASGTAEELVLDFGLHSGAHGDAGPEPVALTQRLVLSWPTAQRLLQTLATLLQHHEARHGALAPTPRLRPPFPATVTPPAPANGDSTPSAGGPDPTIET